MRNAGAPWLLAVPALLAGCSDRQSALAPHGDDASSVFVLTQVLTIGAVVILAMVGCGIWIALKGGRKARATLAHPRTIWIGGLAFPCIVLSLLLGYALWLMRGTVVAASREPAVRIEVRGEQWWWRVTYRLPDGRRVEEANEIRMPAGQEVEFALTSADVIHAFWIPSLGGKMDMIPGRTNRLRLRADRPGTYRGQCAEYCGGPHALMAKDVVVMEPQAFEQWLATSAGPATAGEGQRLFQAAGCGSCHAIRGTAAAGTIGPDLSRIGGRRTIAAATVVNTPDNLERFIASGRHVKPGNRMPEFGFLSPADRRAIALYLTGLK